MDVSDSPVVLVDVSERIGTITLNRPESRNAINGAVSVGLARAIGTLEADDGVDVMIITGADPAFCSGDDVKQIMLAGGDEIRARRATTSSFSTRSSPWCVFAGS